jgi:multimeric flavodoxin WrbA
MQILAVNGSPHGQLGRTERILHPFLEGAREAGADVETVYLKDEQINYCQGCFTCWSTTPGTCIHNDDMPPLLSSIRQGDMVVYATPLYVFSVTAQMKTFMDRHIPLLDPHVVKRGGAYIHPPRYASPSGEPTRVVLISNCGYPERHHFTALQETFRRFTAGPERELAGVILCAAGELLNREPLPQRFQWYIDAVRQAGRETVQQGWIADETQKLLDRPLIDPAVYSRMVNGAWDRMMA